MANRYWVGGAGTWNTTSTTNWSASSGGASGASVPTAADSVFFDQAGTYTVTCTGALTCLDITVSAGTVTFASGTTPSFAISGSMSLVAATVWSTTGTITFNATATGKTITTNGVSLASPTVFNGVGGGWTLGGALTTTSTVTFTNGTFNTGNFTCSHLSWTTATGTKTLTLGSSTINLSSTASALSFSVSTGLTFNANTSTINLTGDGPTCNTGGQTFNNLRYTNTTGSAISYIIGSGSIANLTIAGPTITGIKEFNFYSSVPTITGTFTANSGTYTSRTFIRSTALGGNRTITAATVAIAYCDFQDITGAGAGSWTGTSIGNCYGNTGITFTAAKTVYWNLAGAQNISATGWATTSGGAPAAANFPLAQDTAIFNNAGSVTGTITFDKAWNLGTVDMSARTSAMTFSTGSLPSIYGSWFNGSGVTPSGTGAITFSGRTTQQLTSAGKTFTQSLEVDNLSGTVQCNDALTLGSTRSLTISSGTLKLAAGTTNTVGSFVTSGFSLKYLQSTTAGTQATISDASGTNTVTYLSIKDSNATGGAVFDASDATNVNAGNNTGWTGLSTSLALTGQSATGSVGTVTTSQAVSNALTGDSAAGSTGTITTSQAVSKTLTGVAATGSVDTVTTSQAVSNALTGVSAQGAVGTVTTSQAVSNALTGVQATGSVGTVTAAQIYSQALTGVQADGAVGTVTTSQAVSNALTGVQAAGEVGTILAINGVALPLSGVSAQGNVGVVTSVYYLTGVSAQGAVGTITTSQAVSNALTGVQAAGAVGTITTSQTCVQALTGVSASGILGTIIPIGWSVIDNAQNANWGVINNAQTGSWSLVNNAQTNTWQLINTEP